MKSNQNEDALDTHESSTHIQCELPDIQGFIGKKQEYGSFSITSIARHINSDLTSHAKISSDDIKQNEFQGWKYSSVVECLPTMYKAPGLTTSTTTTNTEQTKHLNK